jgi:hypothetical protein
MQTLGRLLNDDVTPNEQVIRKCDPSLCQLLPAACPVARSLAQCFRSCRLFRKIVMDESRSVSRAELHALIIPQDRHGREPVPVPRRAPRPHCRHQLRGGRLRQDGRGGQGHGRLRHIPQRRRRGGGVRAGDGEVAGRGQA